MPRQPMGKRDQKKFDDVVAAMATIQGKTPEEIMESMGVKSQLTVEEAMYEATAVLHFFESRIQPLMEKDESPEQFDKRFRAWKFKDCKGCGDKFAYAWHYDGVTCCSLDCVAKVLAEQGIEFRPWRDIKRRWGPTSHPAVVPAPALKTLVQQYGHDVPNAFEPSV